jgi:hypothetical protein
MKLADTKFHEALQVLQSMENCSNKSGMRRAPRISVRVDIHVKLAADGAAESWIVAKLWDLSLRGMQMCIGRPMEEGSTFIVRFPSKLGAQPSPPMTSQVIRCRPQSDGTFLVGAEFSGLALTQAAQAASPGAGSDEEERLRRAILG